MKKYVIFADEARSKLQTGVRKLFDAVRVTMGPKGRNVVIEKAHGGPVVTNDGVTIAREIILEDNEENLGVQMIKEAATRTQDLAGDGTTTAIVLATAFVDEGLRNIAAGVNPIGIKKGMEMAVETVVGELEKMKKDITTKEEKAQIATITSKDSEIGNLIADTMEKVKEGGVITVEEGNVLGLHVDFVEGMQFDSGYISPHMVTDTARMDAVVENAKILIYDGKISAIHTMVPVVEAVLASGEKNLVIIADEVEGEALSLLLLNKLKGAFNTLAIRTPSFGEDKEGLIEDIAILTGANVITEKLGMKLEEVKIEDLGTARKVISTKDTTTIVEGGGDEKEIKARIKTIKSEMKEAKSEYDAMKTTSRLAKLTGGVGVIKVGAATEIEMREKKHRIEDTLSATYAAIEEGILQGGGTALLKAGEAIKSSEDLPLGEKVGMLLVKEAIKLPLKQIVQNCGMEGSVIVQEVLGNGCELGFNASTLKVEDLEKAGVIDPKKVTRVALQNAASVAGMFLTTEAAIIRIPPKQ